MVRIFRRLGCLGSLVFAFLFVVAFTALLAPWSFHMGGRLTPTTAWHGVGRLRDSTGQEYGLYASFFPDIRHGYGSRNGPATPVPRYGLRGSARVCTREGLTIPFDLHGGIVGLWLDADGKQMSLNLSEQSKERLKRHFSLYGSFQGSELVLDDHKSMFVYLQSDGKLTPTRYSTSPVPEKHANVTLAWGDASDFENVCRQLRR
jgi:hypothetical protein